jgi:hypothetical protein
MTESEIPSLVFRKTSFTMRERLTPASPCSTCTRMRANFRFVRFSAGVSSPPRGFFFRLASLPDRRFIPLESSILVEFRPRRVGDGLLIGHLLVVCFPREGSAEELDAVVVHVEEDQVLVAVGLLLAAVVNCLFSRVFRPLTPPVGAVDDQPRASPGLGSALGEVPGVPLWDDAHVIQGGAEDRQQAVDPVVSLGLAQAEEFTQDDLQGIGLQVDQDEQQFLFRAGEGTVPSTPDKALTRLAVHSLIDRVQLVPSTAEGCQQQFKLLGGQSSERQELSGIQLDV